MILSDLKPRIVSPLGKDTREYKPRDNQRAKWNNRISTLNFRLKEMRDGTRKFSAELVKQYQDELAQIKAKRDGR